MAIKLSLGKLNSPKKIRKPFRFDDLKNLPNFAPRKFLGKEINLFNKILNQSFLKQMIKLIKFIK